MFMAGLETDLEELNANRNSSLAVALGGIILPFVGGYVSGLIMENGTRKCCIFRITSILRQVLVFPYKHFAI
ncbi:cation:proton antiporter domain-containing protein [Bacillus pacificus]